MGTSIQAHYLPRGSYLSFFESPDRNNSLWMYQRERPPLLLSNGKAARERDLYCFRDKDGRLNSEIEKMLARLEEQTFPVLEKLNGAREDFCLTRDEWALLANFVAFQAVRTPSFRRQLQMQHAELMKAVSQKIALDRRMFAAFVGAARQKRPDLNSERLRAFILSGEYDIEARGDYFLGMAVKMAQPVYRAVMIKKPILLRSDRLSVVTCDSPTILLRNPKSSPLWGKGWINSNVLFPIGKVAALYLQVQLGQNVCNNAIAERIHVQVQKANERKVSWLNKLAIEAAEDYLFVDKKLKSIAERFKATVRPTRFQVANPSRVARSNPLRTVAGRGLRYAVVYTSIFWVFVFVGTQWAVRTNKARLC